MTPAEALKDAFWNLQARRIHVPPCHTTRASSLGAECERFLFYERTQSHMRLPPSPEDQCLFDLGNHIENYVIRKLEDMGVGIYQRGRDYEDKRYDLTGHVDAKLQIPGIEAKVPAEIKGLNPYTAEAVRAIEDIRDNKSSWVRKYYAQLQTYLFLDASAAGVFVILNKSTGQPQFIDCPLDYAFAEDLLKKAERVRDAVKDNKEPARHLTDECHRCPFVHVCKPDLQYGQGVEFWESAETEAMLARRAALEPAAKEFAALDRAVKQSIPHKPELLCGDFAITGKEVSRAGYAVAATKFWQVSIRKLTKEVPHDDDEQAAAAQ